MEINIYSVAGIIAFLFGSSLAFFVGHNSWHNPPRRSFAIVTLLAALWCLFPVAAAFNYGGETNLLLVRLVYIPGVLAPPFILQFIFDVTEDRRPKLKKMILGPAYFVSICFIFFTFHPQFIAGIEKHVSRFVFVPGRIFHIFATQYILICLISFFLLIQNLRRVESGDRTKLQYVAIASTIGIFSPLFHFSSSYYKWEPFPHDIFFFTYSSIIAYAIVRHQLMDIEVIIRRTAVFTGLFAFVYGIFTAVTVIGQEFFKNSLGWNQWVAMIPTVLIITVALRPLEIFLTNATEKYLFQKKYDYRELLRTFTNEILTVLDLQKLMDQTIAGLIRIMKLESASVLLLDKDAKVYKMMAGTGVKDKNLTFKEDDALIASLKATHQPIAQDKTSDKIEGQSALKDEFKSLNARLCLPILLHDNLIGVLCLGMKKSGEDYNQDDMDVLLTLARAEAIAISNAQLFDELSKTQAEAAQREKMAVIGTLAAGINHEICNPLGIVRGQCEMFLLNLRDGFYKNLKQEEVLKISAEVMNKVIRETDRATGITKKLSSFAKPSKRSDFEEVYIEKEVGEVLGLIGHDLQLSNVEVQTDFPKNFPVIVGDKKQIQEVLFNIIRNAAQAMDKKQGKIVVSGFSENGSAVVRIADNGTGIPQDKIEQVFNPFYTTKAPGKGTGLGLFIVKQVVERNKGTIAVESEIGVGTTFTLRFPTPLASLVGQS